MTQIFAYLTFSGNCREAMSFYHECLGGDLRLQTVGDSPLAGQMPQRMKNCILHATLTNGNIMLMASDMVGDQGLAKGNTISLMLDCCSEEELRNYYAKLSSGGDSLHPIEETFWGALFGDLKDKYGTTWLLHFQDKSKMV